MQAPTLFLILFAFAEPRYSQEVVDSAIKRINKQVSESDAAIQVVEDLIERREKNKVSEKEMKNWIEFKQKTKSKQIEALKDRLEQLQGRRLITCQGYVFIDGDRVLPEIRVVQRLDDSAFIGTFTKDNETAIIRGLDVKSIADGDVTTTKIPLIPTGTHSYTAVSGAKTTRRVYEPLSDVARWIREQEKLDKKRRLPELTVQPATNKTEPVQPATNKTEPVQPATGKGGASAYDGFAAPLRDRLVKDWEGELKALERAIESDQQLLKTAKKAQERQKLERYIVEYTLKLDRHKKNDPPYFTKEGREAVDAAK